MSTGGKAGLAIGILLGIFAILAFVYMCFQKRKKTAERERLDDEKVGGNADFSGAARAASQRKAQQAAPRLSLRPLTQLNPFGEGRANQGNTLAAASAPQMAQTNAMSEKPAVNPFGNHAETLDSPNTNGPTMVQTVTPGGEVIMAAAAGAAAGGLTRSASKRANTGPPADLTQDDAARSPSSPTGTEFSMNSATTGAPIATAGGAAIAQAGGPPNSAVHRVQLDFNPSMEDELELKAGQLIRLLHEYDDGWVSYQEPSNI